MWTAARGVAQKAAPLYSSHINRLSWPTALECKNFQGKSMAFFRTCAVNKLICFFIATTRHGY